MNPTDLQPHSPESERHVIGALLIEPAYMARVAALVKPADFYAWEHRAVFEAIAQLGAGADNLGIEQALTRMPAADDRRHANAAAEIVALTRGPIETYLTLIAADVLQTGPEAAERHAQEVADQATRRRMIAAASKVATMAHDQAQPAAELVDLAMAELTKAGADRRDARPELDQIAADYLAERENEWTNKGKPTGIPSGLVDLDRLTNGWKAGNLVIVAGPTSSGKTTLMLQMALHAARQGRRVLVLTLEMDARQILRKLVANVGQIDTTAHATPNPEKEHAAINAITRLPIQVQYTPGATVAEIVAECYREHARRKGLDLVVVDYVQIMGTPLERGQTRAAALGTITRELRTVAGKLGAVVMLGSQLNREGSSVDGGAAPVPQLAMLKESGDIEQHATHVLMLHDPKDEKDPTQRNLYLAKNQIGITGKVYLLAEMAYSTFADAYVETVKL